MTVELSWETLRPIVDDAIRDGRTCKEFLFEQDINASDWIKVKPKEFNWHRVRRELGLTKTPERKPKEEQIPEFEEIEVPEYPQVAIVVTDTLHLKHVLESLL